MSKTAIDTIKRKSNLYPGILDRYVSREFLFSYLIAIVVVLSLRVLLDLFAQFDEFVESEHEQAVGLVVVLGRIVGYYGPKLLEYFRDFSGMIILLAAAFALTRMTRHNELTAVLASGISLKRVIAPIIVLAVGLNLVMVADQELFLPRLADKLVRNHDEVDVQGRTKVWFLPDGQLEFPPGLKGLTPAHALLSAREYDPATRTMYDMLVILRRDEKLVGRVMAEQATWDENMGHWNLTQGRYFVDDDPGLGSGVNLAGEVDTYVSELTPEYLWMQRNSNFKSLMSWDELTGLLRRGLKSTEAADVISERHFRFADPIINMVMLLLGLPMLVSRERREMKSAIFMTVMLVGGCFVATFACKLLAGTINPFIAAFLPVIVFFPVSVVVLDSLKT